VQTEVKDVSSRRREVLISLATLERHAGYRLVEFPENGLTYAFCACGMTHELVLIKGMDYAGSAKMWWLDHVKRIRPPIYGQDQPMALNTLLAAADALLDALYVRETPEFIEHRRHELRVAVAAVREELKPA
jgi:hypothetical protein